MPESPGGGDAGAPPHTTETENSQPDQTTVERTDAAPPVLSKNAQKKLAKQQRYEAKKAEKKAAAKEHKRREVERKRKEWEESLAGVTEEEREKLLESRRNLRKERMEKRLQEKEDKRERLSVAREKGQNVVVDLQFSNLMNPNEIHSLVQQVRCSTQLLFLRGFYI